MLFLQHLAAAFCWLAGALTFVLPLGRWLPAKAPAAQLFNRYTVRYTADVRLKGELRYSIGPKEITETFFLEAAGEPAVFQSFIDGFLDGKLASKLDSKLDSVTFTALDGGGGTYEVESAVLTRAKAPCKDARLLLEDAFCQAGVSLRWGGAIDSFVWKAAPKGFGNLLNRADEGRLVQQSYYGTSDPPYVQGSFMGNPWGYNPVQGGDQHGNRSKLVDYAIRDQQIYVKCRPADWSKDGELTPAYMENTYTLADGVLAADNRFVDFSGLAHPARHQELPACYVVSALDTFSFYGGAQPWTDGALTQRNDLPFWGTGAECYMPLHSAETWCAWTAGAGPEAFGVGLYTPGAEILLAGKHGTKATADPNDGATNYVAPLRTLQMTPAPFEYRYYLTAGTLAGMRALWTGMQ